MRYKIRILVLLFIVCLVATSCSMKFSKLKKEQFDSLKQNVTQFLGASYNVKKITIVSEGYSNDTRTEYVVDFSFDLNKPLMLLPSTNIPGKLIFKKDPKGGWSCIFNSGNPNDLFNILQ